MALQTLVRTLADAERGGYAVGAFNVSDLNQAVAVLDAAWDENSPVIIQTIAGMHPYRDEGWWWDQLRQLIDSYGGVQATLHLDHGTNAQDCQRAIDHGFTSVMIDASRDARTGEPNRFEANVSATHQVVTFAHPAGVSVEGELGTVGSAEERTHGVPEAVILADPALAEQFVASTGVDALAVAIGTSHGSVKFLGNEAERLRIDLVGEIKARIPETYLVLHGSSSIPHEAVDTINANGGNVAQSKGIATDQKQEAIALGIRKINQGTDSHLSWTARVREAYTTRPEVVEPSIAIRAGMTGLTDIVRQRMKEFGSAGQAV